MVPEFPVLWERATKQKLSRAPERVCHREVPVWSKRVVKEELSTVLERVELPELS